MGIINDINALCRPRRLDADGQPPRPFRAEANIDRQISEMIGMIRMALSDGELEHHEATFLLEWLESNIECADTWPASAIYPRLAGALEDGIIDPDEEADLLSVLLKTIGKPTRHPDHGIVYATRLPITEPPPVIEFEERSFCFTGKLISGSRAWAMQQVEMLGGYPATSITKTLNYLVLGDLGSRDWIQSTHGRKIEKAMAYIQEGTQIAIVSEERWHESLRYCSP